MGIRANMGVSARKLTGLIFAVVGGAVLAVGVMTGLDFYGAELTEMGWPLAGMGGGIFLVGMAVIWLSGKQKTREQKLMAKGNYVLAEVVELSTDYATTVAGRHPLRFTVRYEDPDGNAFLLKSAPQHIPEDTDFTGRKVRVYVGDDSFKRYYVDMNSLFSENDEA